MAQNNKNKRKLAAVLLGIVGVAGLSVASASTLTVNTTNEVALGSDTFESCDTAVSVDYAYDAATKQFTDLTVSDIATACVGEPISVVVKAAGGSTLFTSAAAATVTGGTTTFANALAGNAISTDLGDVTVVIG